jgi:hypothetical protein
MKDSIIVLTVVYSIIFLVLLGVIGIPLMLNGIRPEDISCAKLILKIISGIELIVLLILLSDCYFNDY